MGLLADECQSFPKRLVKIAGCRRAHRAEKLESAQWGVQGRGGRESRVLSATCEILQGALKHPSGNV